MREGGVHARVRGKVAGTAGNTASTRSKVMDGLVRRTHLTISCLTPLCFWSMTMACSRYVSASSSLPTLGDASAAAPPPAASKRVSTNHKPHHYCRVLQCNCIRGAPTLIHLQLTHLLLSRAHSRMAPTCLLVTWITEFSRSAAVSACQHFEHSNPGHACSGYLCLCRAGSRSCVLVNGLTCPSQGDIHIMGSDGLSTSALMSGPTCPSSNREAARATFTSCFVMGSAPPTSRPADVSLRVMRDRSDDPP